MLFHTANYDEHLNFDIRKPLDNIIAPDQSDLSMILPTIPNVFTESLHLGENCSGMHCM